MAFDRLFETDKEAADERAATSGVEADRDMASIRQAIADLESLPMDRRRFLSGYAYVLVRVARTDAELTEAKTARIEQAVMAAGNLSETEGALLVSLAGRMSLIFGATEDYAVTREFARNSSPQERQRLMRACVAVGTAEGPLAGPEIAELHEIGRELGFNADEVEAIREQVDPAPGRRRQPG